MADDATASPHGGGAWLTYRYRLAVEGVTEAAGTIKAPSFGTAARRILARLAARGLGDALAAGPVYLRLRAAGEEEVLLRAERADADPGRPWRVEAVLGQTYEFAAPFEAPTPRRADPPPS